MTTRLDKTLKRELTLEGRTFIVAVSPEGLKLTLKGKRKGQELRWGDLISGDAALAAALNASVGALAPDEAPARAQPPQPRAQQPQPQPRAQPQPKTQSAERPARKRSSARRAVPSPVRAKSKRAPRARKG